VPSPSPAIGGVLIGTAASANSAWAVGQTASDNPDTLTLRWNGRSWRRVPSPSPGPSQKNYAILNSVAEVSATSAWAVGTCDGATAALILRWNGRAWRRIASPT